MKDNERFPGDRERTILLIDFMYPLPEDMGRRMRTMNFVRFFRRIGAVDILYFIRESKEGEDQGYFRKEHYLRHPSRRKSGEIRFHKRVAGRARRVWEKRPWLITDWSDQSLGEYLSVVEEGNYDIIFCRYILDTYPLFYLPDNIREKVIIDFDDLFSGSLFERYSGNHEHWLPRMKTRLQKYFLSRYEQKCLGFGAAFFTTRSDQEKIVGTRIKDNTFVIPNTYPCSRSYPDGDDSGFLRRNTILFLGALNYGPNVDGLKWFIETIFRNIHQHDNIRLLVVGRQPTPEVKSLCESISGIELHSDVPDVTPFYQRCGIVVVPILTGGGTRIKILEAGMACRAVLSTPMGAAGLDVVHGKDLFLFTNRETFLEGCDQLSRKDVYDRIVRNMRDLVDHTYSPESFDRKVTEAIRPFMK
jgi:glycosyltransferase involved in cell wall biosynthesis